MKSLTDRLREQDWPEAADRIDELEAALTEIAGLDTFSSNTRSALQQAGDVARGVLAAGATPNNETETSP